MPICGNADIVTKMHVRVLLQLTLAELFWPECYVASKALVTMYHSANVVREYGQH